MWRAPVYAPAVWCVRLSLPPLVCRPLQFEVKEVSKKFDKGERQRTRRFVIFYLSRRLRLQCGERVLPRRMRSHLPLRALLLAVTRLSCRLAEEGYEMGLDLDLNSDLLQLETNDKFVRERERGRERAARTHPPTARALRSRFRPRAPRRLRSRAPSLSTALAIRAPSIRVTRRRC